MAPLVRPAAGSLKSAPVRRVAVLVDTSTTWGRNVVLGINRYCREHSRWEIFVEPRGQLERMRLPKGWKGDGVIARVSQPSMARELQAARIPVVNVSGIQLAASAGFPRVTTDLMASGKMAAHHFLHRGFRHFAYLGLQGLEYVQTHQDAFFQAVLQAGAHFSSLSLKPMAGAEADWRLDLGKLGQWLAGLPKPVAVLCWNPGSARAVVFACHEAGLLVPDEVAVLSQADDEILCEASLIPISGIAVASDRIGYQAAATLEELMQGKAPKLRTTRIAPASIVTRQSTETLAVHDPVLVKAMSFIRQSVRERNMDVSAVARYAGTSRRALERRFAETFQRSPAQEIRRARLERAKQLLVETRLPMTFVAEECGLGSQSHFAAIFRQQCGQTPLQYRKENSRPFCTHVSAAGAFPTALLSQLPRTAKWLERAA